jgi:hypothetical protein
VGKIKQVLNLIWDFVKKSFDQLVSVIEQLTAKLREKDNVSGRLSVFVVIYLFFSAVGAYNFAHLAAFIYIIWLLEGN